MECNFEDYNKEKEPALKLEMSVPPLAYFVKFSILDTGRC